MHKIIFRDGCTLSYEVSGEGDSTILFIQGAGVHGSGWKPQIDAFSKTFRCITFDNRGIGQSRITGVHDRLTIEQMAVDARAILENEHVTDVHVVGHSLGGLVAQSLALQCVVLKKAVQVKTLSLLCTFGRGADGSPLSFRMIWAGLRSVIGTRRQRRHGFLQFLLTPLAYRTLSGSELDAAASALAPLFGHDLALQPAVTWKQLRAMKNYDAFPKLERLGSKLTLPVLIVSARHDPIAPPAAGLKLSRAYQAGRYVEIEDASHGLPLTHVFPINELLTRHFTAKWLKS